MKLNLDNKHLKSETRGAEESLPQSSELNSTPPRRHKPEPRYQIQKCELERAPVQNSSHERPKQPVDLNQNIGSETHKLSCQRGGVVRKDEPAEPIFQNQILTVREVAKFLKLSTKTVYKRVSSGEIPHKKIGDEIRFLLPELMSWMKGQDYV